jgi:hypothetical protein
MKLYINTEYLDTHIQGDSRLVDITAGGDFLGLCDGFERYAEECHMYILI